MGSVQGPLSDSLQKRPKYTLDESKNETISSIKDILASRELSARRNDEEEHYVVTGDLVSLPD